MEFTDRTEQCNHTKRLWKNFFWEELWVIKLKAVLQGDAYRQAFEKYSKYKQYIDYAVLLCTMGSAIASVFTINDVVTASDVVGAVFSTISAILSSVVVISKWDRMAHDCGLAYKHLDFLQSEIEKYMSLHSSTMELKQIYEIMLSFFNFFDTSKEIIDVPALCSAPPPSLQMFGSMSPINYNMKITAPTTEYIDTFLIIEMWKPLIQATVLSRAQFEFDEEGFIADVDDDYYLMFNVEPDRPVNPFRWLSNLHHADGQRVCAHWFGSVNEKKIFFDKFRIVASKTETKYLVCEAYPKYSSLGKFRGMIGLCIELEDREWNGLDVSCIHDILNHVSQPHELEEAMKRQSNP